jgi:hypothetical protein
MFAPFIPSYSASSHGLSLQRVLALPFTQNWYNFTTPLRKDSIFKVDVWL